MKELAERIMSLMPTYDMNHHKPIENPRSCHVIPVKGEGGGAVSIKSGKSQIGDGGP